MFLISIMISLFYLVFLIFISVNWIYDIACYFGYFVAIYLVTFIALIPGFIYVFTLISLFFDKKKKKINTQKEPDVTVLIPIYNAKNAIAYTEVPEKLKDLGKQRKRWARGMIEAFKKIKPSVNILNTPGFK